MNYGEIATGAGSRSTTATSGSSGSSWAWARAVVAAEVAVTSTNSLLPRSPPPQRSSREHSTMRSPQSGWSWWGYCSSSSSSRFTWYLREGLTESVAAIDRGEDAASRPPGGPEPATSGLCCGRYCFLWGSCSDSCWRSGYRSRFWSRGLSPRTRPRCGRLPSSWPCSSRSRCWSWSSCYSPPVERFARQELVRAG